MEKWKAMVIMLVSIVLAGCTTATAALTYDNFESYNNDNALWSKWKHADEGNPFMTPHLDTTVKYEGNKSMRLDSPLMDGNSTSGYHNSDADWGVILRDSGLTTNISAYNVMTAMVMADSNSSTYNIDIVVRDNSGVDIGDSGTVDMPNDGNWHQITVVLNGDGDKTALKQILSFFDIEPNVPAGIHQFWMDYIRFDHMFAIDDVLEIDVNGPLGAAGGIVKYSFIMTQQPPADVNFILAPNELLDYGAGFNEPLEITFTPANWSIMQEIAINIDSSAAGILTVDVGSSSTDPNYNTALPTSFDVVVLGPFSASYVISPNTPTWTGNGSDNSGIDLANGIFATGLWDEELILQEDLVEWAPGAVNPPGPPYAEITFDFGYAKDVNTVDIYHAADGYPPGSFELSYSLDDVNYSAPTVHEPSLGDVISKTHIEVSPDVNARYVKLVVKCDANDPNKWFFLSEVEFNGQVIPPYYIIDPNNMPLGDHKDSWKGKLFNGIISYFDNENYTDWVYFEEANYAPYNNVILYADYGSVKEFSNLSLNYASDANSDSAKKLWAPSAVNLSFSDDGVSYGTPVSLTGWYQGTTTAAPYGVTDAKTFAPHTGQYVKIEIVRNTANAVCLRFGEIILSNRPQMTYAVDINTPLWGGSTDEPGDVATEPNLETLKFGDLANGHIPTQAGPYNDRDWVEWAPDQFPGKPPYGMVTFDLKSVVKVKNAAIAYSSGYNDTYAPDKLDAAFSTDGVNFSAMTDVGAVFINDMNSPRVFNTVFTLPETQARYVKLRIHCKNDNPVNWIFISEVKFNVFTADFDDNGVVDFEDLKTMADQWLQTGSDLSTDIAGDDEKVNFLDFAEFATEWMY